MHYLKIDSKQVCSNAIQVARKGLVLLKDKAYGLCEIKNRKSQRVYE